MRKVRSPIQGQAEKVSLTRVLMLSSSLQAKRNPLHCFYQHEHLAGQSASMLIKTEPQSGAANWRAWIRNKPEVCSRRLA